MYKRILKKLRNELAELLTKICALIKTKICSGGWQVCGVYPIFRLVSITSAQCKWPKQEYERE